MASSGGSWKKLQKVGNAREKASFARGVHAPACDIGCDIGSWAPKPIQ
jgi:hypothetical protein